MFPDEPKGGSGMPEQKINYQKALDAEIEQLNGRVPKLLLHVCCAPCSSYVLEYLSEFYEITVFYYNPNISPEEEYRKRVDEEKRFISEITPKHPVHFLEGRYEPERWREAIRGLEAEKEGGARCTVCFGVRLEETARICREGGYDCMTTTLTISPLKDADRLNRIGAEMAEKYGVTWLPSDFKKKGGYLRSIELSRKHGLYRQNFCGCSFSRRSPE